MYDVIFDMLKDNGPDGAGAEHVGTEDGSKVPATAVTMYARAPC